MDGVGGERDSIQPQVPLHLIRTILLGVSRQTVSAYISLYIRLTFPFRAASSFKSMWWARALFQPAIEVLVNQPFQWAPLLSQFQPALPERKGRVTEPQVQVVEEHDAISSSLTIIAW